LHELGEPLAVLRIPKPADWVSQNKRLHWGQHKAIKDAWRLMTLTQCRIQQFPKELPPCIIIPIFVFDSTRRRDRGNFTPTTKVIIDAMCHGPRPPYGWGAWPDDDDRFIEERMPVLHSLSKGSPQGVIIRCYPKV